MKKEIKLKKEKPLKTKWLLLPEKTELAWFSEFLVSSMVLNVLAKNNKLPKFVRTDGILSAVPNKRGCKCKNGDLKFDYEVKF